MKETARQDGWNVVAVSGKNEPIRTPIIQYMETDWEFLKRMASRFGTTAVPEITTSFPQASFGVVQGNTYEILADAEYEIGKNVEQYHRKAACNTCTPEQFVYFRVRDSRNMSLGDKATFQGYKLIVVKKEASLKNGLLEIWYTLGYEQCFGEVRHTNRKISGMSILGTVLETKGELLQLHLEIDKKPTGDNWYRYAPATGNMLYCMPKKGTEVSLYFPDDEEAHAVVINCIRKNGTSCAQMSNPAMRQLSTEYGKNLNLSPQSVSISSKLNQMRLADAESVNLSSSLSMVIRSKQSISVIAKQMLTLNAGCEFVAQRNPFVLTRFDGTNMVEKARYIVYTGESQQYTDCKQLERPKSAEERKRELGLGVARNIAFGLLAVIACAALAVAVVGSGGTVLLAAPAIGAAIGAAVATAAITVTDVQNGQARSALEACTAIAEGASIGFITGAVCANGAIYLPIVAQNIGMSAMALGGLSAAASSVIAEAATVSGLGLIGANAIFGVNEAFAAGSEKNILRDVVFEGNEDSYQSAYISTTILTNWISEFGALAAALFMNYNSIRNAYQAKFKPRLINGSEKTIISPEMEKKILEGQRKVKPKNQVIGGHSPNIINNNNPNFAVEVMGANPDGTVNVKYVKGFSDGTVSKIKNNNTLFPNTWSDESIINSIRAIGGTPPVGIRPRDGATLHRGIINGVQVEVIKVGSNVTSGYPTGGGATGVISGFNPVN